MERKHNFKWPSMQNENYQFKETKTLLSNSYLIRYSSHEYRCKSGIVIFSWRVTWNYAHSPCKDLFHSNDDPDPSSALVKSESN